MVIQNKTVAGNTKIEEGGALAEVLNNENVIRLETGATRFRVLDWTTTIPSSPTDQDAYLVAAGATGAWLNEDDKVAIWSDDSGAWLMITPKENDEVYVDDVDLVVRYDGSGWTGIAPPYQNHRRGSVTRSITASATQTQGQQPLTTEYNEVTTVATTDDVVTLPTAVTGIRVVIWNAGANQLQIYPASGDKIDGGSVDASTTLAAATSVTLVAVDATEWLTE